MIMSPSIARNVSYRDTMKRTVMSYIQNFIQRRRKRMRRRTVIKIKRLTEKKGKRKTINQQLHKVTIEVQRKWKSYKKNFKAQ